MENTWNLDIFFAIFAAKICGRTGKIQGNTGNIKLLFELGPFLATSHRSLEVCILPAAGCVPSDLVKSMVIECNVGYNMFDEENQNYTVFWDWLPPNSSTPSGEVEAAFRYHR